MSVVLSNKAVISMDVTAGIACIAYAWTGLFGSHH